jgi:hypothetical protein
VNRGITFPSGDATLTQDQANEIQRNYQAIRIIKSSLTSEEYDKVDGLKSAKEVWDTLFINHEGTKQVREGRIQAWRVSSIDLSSRMMSLLKTCTTA